MARPLRHPVADGWHHVFGRGLERRDIFGDVRDGAHILELLAKRQTWLSVVGSRPLRRTRSADNNRRRSSVCYMLRPDPYCRQ